ncbi:MAG: DUF4936 family protein [Burkholderiaceae bacterium]|nr:DUF4936 family protein [Burkholderiaceae bacterium]
MHLFVYYKFKPEDYPDVALDAKRLIAAVEKSVPGVRASLLKRPEVGSTGEHTWMETYEFGAGHKPLLELRLTELVGDSGLPRQRHLEWFVEV